MKIAVTTTINTLTPNAKKLALQLGIPFTNFDDKTFPFLLSLDESGLSLIQSTAGPIKVDFLAEKLSYRRRAQQKELISKAVGITANFKPSIVDATAGFGTDAFILASLGARVTLIEKSNIVFSLLQDGFNRASQDLTLEPILKNMTLIHQNSIDYLNSLTNKPDVIYLDPMFPERKKTALVKKEMQALQALLEPDDDIERLFKVALKTGKRVVVKRPRLAPLLSKQKPTFQLTAKSCRFDVYEIT